MSEEQEAIMDILRSVLITDILLLLVHHPPPLLLSALETAIQPKGKQQSLKFDHQIEIHSIDRCGKWV